ncbi:unnamed protein product [Sphenostylis stenocarpa]|uniref:Uncharacterized protein n=1 Tax=Sphenostylis stenocarpa TaxID=92480 RepID=A0AA86VYQ3_9FABA|nr:unnamed protein product [Sphenostylis stenocarpa]
MTQHNHHLHTHNHNQMLFWQENICAYFHYFADSMEGVPAYPLYKRLASALLRCMDSETFCRTGGNLAMVHEFEDSSIQQKQQVWHKLIVEKGFEILNVNNAVLTDPFCLLCSTISTA